jgi:hypothetical protein
MAPPINKERAAADVAVMQTAAKLGNRDAGDRHPRSR